MRDTEPTTTKTSRSPLTLLLLAALAGGGLIACDDGGASDTPDATDPDVTDPDVTDPDVTDPDVTEPGECEGQPDGMPCGDPSEDECDLADTCLDEVCVPNLVEAGVGVVFDVELVSDARVSGLSLELAEGERDVTVLFRRGTGAGHESSLDGWEPVGATSVTSAGAGELSLVGFDTPIEASAGETISFLVDAGPEGLGTNEGAEVGAVVSSTATASIRVGTALDSPETATIVRGAVEGGICAP